MSTEILASKYHLTEMRFHRIQLDIPSYDDIDNKDGTLSIQTSLRFGVDSEALYCTLGAIVSITPDDQRSRPPEEKAEMTFEVVGTARFALPHNHGISDDKLNRLSSEEVDSFSRVLDPIMVIRIKEILADAGINGSTIPLQLKSLLMDHEAS